MSFLKSTFALFDLTVLLAACDPVPATGPAATATGANAIELKQMDKVFKPMRIAEARANPKARGYTRSTTRNKAGVTTEIWRGVYARGGKNVARGWVSLDTCANSQLLAKTRVSLTNMSSALAAELLAFARNRTNAPRGQLAYSLGGIRLFDKGDRRIGISTHTSCG